MDLKTKIFKNTAINYYQHGSQPRFLILSGTHGDEWKIINCVKQTIQKALDRLPDFIFIPAVSPSAVARKTRENHQRIDLNRHFFGHSKFEEIQAVKKVVADYCFELCFSFHEDLQQRAFYFYDSGNLQGSAVLQGLQTTIKDCGLPLLNGIDDANDPILGHCFSDGYCSLMNKVASDNGTFDYWALKHGIVRRMITLEVPGLYPVTVKRQIVDIFFKHVVLKLA